MILTQDKIATNSPVLFGFLFFSLLQLLGLFFSHPGNSSEIVQVNSGAATCVLGDYYVDFLEDRDGSLTIDAILKKSEANFQQLHGKTAGFGFTTSVYWFRFSIQSNLIQGSKLFLKIGYPLLDDISLYSPDSSGGYTVYQTGDHFPFKQRYLAATDFVFPLTLPPETVQTFYLRVQTSSSMTVPMLICSTTYFIEHISHEKMILGIFFGILLVMMIHNFFVYASTREISHWYYVLFVASNLLFQFSLNGLTFQFLWPEQIWLANNILPIMVFCCYLTASQFARTFLDSKLYTPLGDKILLVLNYFAIAGIITSFLIDYALAIKIATSLIFTVPLFIAIGIQAMLRGHRSAIYYCLGWSVSLLGYFIFALKSFGVLPQVFLTQWGIQIGSAWEIILFSVGLADRFQVIKKEKEALQHSYALKMEQSNQQLSDLVGRLSLEVSTRRKVEKALRKSEHTARSLIDTPLNTAILLDRNGVIVDGNKTFADSLKRQLSFLIGTKIVDWYPQTRVIHERWSHLENVLQTGVMARFEDCLDGAYFDHTMTPIYGEKSEVTGVSILSQNITIRMEANRARQELEVKALNQAKLASLGQIATGIAHEINQPLSYIKIIFESMIIDLKENRLDLDELIEDARESLRQLARITTIISHLRIFARDDCSAMTGVDLVQAFRDSLILMGQRIKNERIEIKTNFSKTPHVLGNQVKLEQVFINLLQNSMDAIKEKSVTGLIEVNICSSSSGEINLQFSDNGIGLADLGNRIFEPFFTTKEPGAGTGLGLSIIYGIITEHNGTITCKANKYGGATFSITLPAYDV